MKRTALQRRSPLRAKRARMKAAVDTFVRATGKPRGKSKTKHARRERAPAAWFQFVKAQGCFVAYLWRIGVQGTLRPTPCSETIDADHMGDRMKQGDGTRALDATCVGICHGHHMQRHAFAGAFKGFGRDDMRAFTSTAVQWTQNRAKAAGVVIPAC